MLPLNTQHPAPTFDLRRSLRRAQWFFITRVRGSFEDIGYATLLATSLIVYNVLFTFVNDQMTVPLAARIDGAAHGIFLWACLMFPAVLILSMALRLAPPQGARRWAWAIGAAILGTLWGNRCAVLLFKVGHPTFGHISQGFVTFLLICVGAFLNNTLRQGKADLFKAELDSTALDAEFQRAQLELLRAQVEPHFLFNTLATVRTLALAEPATAAVLIDDLLRYLAAALPKLRTDDSSLEDEAELIEAYLRIQQVRMGSRLSYGIRIPHALKDLKVPSVMLLTLVENAIKHGVGPAADGGSVGVSAAREVTVLTLRVIDSGLGMKAQAGSGSGLANVRARLALRYGGRASLSLESASPRGVAATIRIPLDATA
ncbi:MAG TPA: histidine kinase [Steroidobacteraceae bacterium]|nr:histidine kinase [Steroidobacteraceae bacterium]